MSKYLSIAIDGPSGAGKSTLAKMCAEKFGFIYVDTGAIYRTVGVAVRSAGLAPKDEKGVEALLDSLNISIKYGGDGLQRMLLNGGDVTEALRQPEISLYASDISAMPAVRAFLLDKQRGFAENGPVIMDGRDIGTVVLPDADLKIFLTAAPEERARRRFAELALRGVETCYQDVLKDILYRDKNDSARSAAPLRPAKDAVILDTTGNSIEKSFGLLCVLIGEKLPG
ncbi:MAG: (d)CMP kinase [Oscillospiraceae bacterium]|jgi:cytidylate kinase|nr:(d)CMP kinase [Oscillospiraceae bacterium]